MARVRDEELGKLERFGARLRRHVIFRGCGAPTSASCVSSKKGDQVEGCYSYRGRSTVAGAVEVMVALSLAYHESDGTTGTAEFKLGADGLRLHRHVEGGWRDQRPTVAGRARRTGGGP